MNHPTINLGFWIESTEAFEQASVDGVERWTREIVRGALSLPEVESVLILCPQGSEESFAKILDTPSKKLHIFGAFTSPPRSTNSAGSARDAEIQAQYLSLYRKAQLRLPWISPEFTPAISWRRTAERFVEAGAIFAFAWMKLRVGKGKHRIQRIFSKKTNSQDRFSDEITQTLQKFKPIRWVVPNPLWLSTSNIAGDRILLVPESLYVDHQVKLLDNLNRSDKLQVQKNIASAAKVFCLSSHCKETNTGLFSASSSPVTVLKQGVHTSASSDSASKEEMELLLQRHLREVKMNRHFCDFPFSQCNYILLNPSAGSFDCCRNAILAYEQILRRYRFSLKLIVTADLDSDPEVSQLLSSEGLVFDVVQAPRPSRSLFAALLKHSVCNLIPTGQSGGFPLGFFESSLSNIPVAMSKVDSTKVVLGDDFTQREYFNPNCEGDIAQSLRYILLNREAVIERQQRVTQDYGIRSWEEIARDIAIN